MSEVSDECLICHWYCDEVLEECKGQEKPCHEFKLSRECMNEDGDLNE